MEKDKQQKKVMEYAVLISDALDVLLDVESENYIGAELHEGRNATHFFHALANVVPHNIYRNMTMHEVDLLEFNHVANTSVPN